MGNQRSRKHCSSAVNHYYSNGGIMKRHLLIATLIAAFATAAFAQDTPTGGNDDDKAYCKYLAETAKAQALQYVSPAVSNGVTQPNTGTAPQTFVGLTGSLANLRK